MKEKIQISSNKSFGVVFFIFFFIISVYPLTKDQNIIIWCFVISIIFLILGLLNSSVLTPLNKIWFKFGIFLGKIVSPLVMGIIFFFSCNSNRFIYESIRKRSAKFKI